MTQQYGAQQQYGRPVEGTVLTNLLTDMNFIQLLHRFEIELSSFSFTDTDDIHSVAALLKVSYCDYLTCRFRKFGSSATFTIFQSHC